MAGQVCRTRPELPDRYSLLLPLWQLAGPCSSRQANDPGSGLKLGNRYKRPGQEGRGLLGGPQAQPLTPTKNNATYISLKLNKLANVPSSNVEILLLLMSLEERGFARI